MLNIEEGNALLKKKLLSNDAFLVARFGSSEMDYILEYLGYTRQRFSYVRYLLGRKKSAIFSNRNLESCKKQTGFYPATTKHLKIFCEQIISDMDAIDVLGSWLPGEEIILSRLPQTTQVPLRSLEPYYTIHNPWSSELKGKKVLVIHPFSRSIESQFQKRHLLFPNTNVLPDFDLQVYQSVQSGSSALTEFKTWFEALDKMKEDIEKLDFDVAIIGCGAYGMPLGFHVKNMGKQAIHLGGATQLLFGIKGGRWDNHPEISALYNEHWVRPLEDEKPKGFKKMEDACYW